MKANSCVTVGVPEHSTVLLVCGYECVCVFSLSQPRGHHRVASCIIEHTKPSSPEPRSPLLSALRHWRTICCVLSGPSRLLLRVFVCVLMGLIFLCLPLCLCVWAFTIGVAFSLCLHLSVCTLTCVHL